MRIPKLTALLCTLLLVLFTAAASADSRETRCNSTGRVLSYVSGHSGAFDVTLTWPKVGTDADIAVFLQPTGDLIGLGASVEPRFETVTVGSLPGVPLDILVVKFGGPNTKCFLYTSSRDGGVGGTSSRGQLRYRGTIEDLAQQSPRYEQMWETYKRVMKAKGWDPEQ